MSHLIKIYEALLNRKGKVCSRAEIFEIIKEYQHKFKFHSKKEDILKYLSRHDYIVRIFHGYYYINSIDERKRKYVLYEDKEILFAVLNNLNIKWYIGLASALYLAGKSLQVPNTLHIINSQFSGARKIMGLRVRFFKVKDRLFSGLKKAKTSNGIEYAYSPVKKAYDDLVYLGFSGRQLKKGASK
jgi:predicted transcriptional regulator of viral defense system